MCRSKFFLLVGTKALFIFFPTRRFEGSASLMQGTRKSQEVLVIVLSDILFFLQEVSQHKYSLQESSSTVKYTFFTPDNKVRNKLEIQLLNSPKINCLNLKVNPAHLIICISKPSIEPKNFDLSS